MSFHRQKASEEENNKVLNILQNILIESIRNIDSDYILSYDIKLKKVKAQLERVFAYELYHQWSCLLQNSDYNLDFKINGEPFKMLDRSHKYYEPDLVLHGGQFCEDNNFIVCEIKRAEGLSIENIITDFSKFTFFLNSKSFKYPYLRAVFIVVNSNKDKFAQIVSNSKINKWNKKQRAQDKGSILQKIDIIKDRILCITKSTDKTEVFGLSEIFNK